MDLPIHTKHSSSSLSPKPSDCTVVVVGRGYSNILGIARAVGEAGYRVEVLRVFKKHPRKTQIIKSMRPEAYSKYVLRYDQCVAISEAVVVRSLLRMGADAGFNLLIPVDDFVALIVDRHFDKLSSRFMLPSVKEGGGELLRIACEKVSRKNLHYLRGFLLFQVK